MTDFDPTSPWGERSPWEIAQPDTNTAPEAPVTNQPAPVATSPNPFKIGFTLKAASGYDAEWLTPTVYGASAEETAQRGKDLLVAMKNIGLIEFTAQAAAYTRGTFLGGGKAKPAASAPQAQPTFQNGQVQYQQPAQAPQAPFGAAAGGDTCTHGRTPREGTNTKGPWAALFCNERNKAAQCPPLWRGKDGTYS
ncbi:hypothetical protein OG306_33380 [Streptomyces sp. NBC_01241]|uniref:hypothetical protein n=1 Tax=Streptomyces sp. NBC_01241 TaxID=2903794 RepID=UPI00352F2F49|nr:hypothetical protein OG306_33380 [Streptomyces sp. NBC_01241]